MSRPPKPVRELRKLISGAYFPAAKLLKPQRDSSGWAGPPSAVSVRCRAVDTDLACRVVIVTGAARGIGAATARRFAGEGAKVVVNYRTSGEQAERLAAELPDAMAVRADISQEGEVDALFAAALDRYGAVD